MNSMGQLSERDITAILELHDRWLKEELAGNEYQIIRFCTDDIRWIPPNTRPLEGKATIAKYLAGNHVELKDIQIADTRVYGSDSLAYLTSNFSTRYVTQQTAGIHESTGTHLWILRNEAGVWQVTVVAWSSWDQGSK